MANERTRFGGEDKFKNNSRFILPMAEIAKRVIELVALPAVRFDR